MKAIIQATPSITNKKAITAMLRRKTWQGFRDTIAKATNSLKPFQPFAY